MYNQYVHTYLLRYMMMHAIILSAFRVRSISFNGTAFLTRMVYGGGCAWDVCPIGP